MASTMTACFFILTCTQVLACAPPETFASASSGPYATLQDPLRITKIVDGDTLEVDYYGHLERVRLKGINCPELHPEPQPFAQEAKDYVQKHVGKRVGLVLRSPV